MRSACRSASALLPVQVATTCIGPADTVARACTEPVRAREGAVDDRPADRSQRHWRATRSHWSLAPTARVCLTPHITEYLIRKSSWVNGG